MQWSPNPKRIDDGAQATPQILAGWVVEIKPVLGRTPGGKTFHQSSLRDVSARTLLPTISQPDAHQRCPGHQLVIIQRGRPGGSEIDFLA